MPTTINTHEAKTHLSQLLIRVEAGEEIIIARSGKAIARLVAIEPPAKKVRLGGLKGKVWMAPDWDSPDEEIVSLFENSRIFSE